MFTSVVEAEETISEASWASYNVKSEPPVMFNKTDSLRHRNLKVMRRDCFLP